MSKGKMFVISGASGVGKSTVLKQVMDGRDDLKFSVSATILLNNNLCHACIGVCYFNRIFKLFFINPHIIRLLSRYSQ